MVTISSYTMTGLLEKIYNSNGTYVSNESKTGKKLVSNDDITAIKNESDTFQKKIRKLKNYNVSTHQSSKIIRNLTAFVKEYNKYKKMASETNNSEIDKKMNEFNELVSDNKKLLKRIGLSINEKGVMKFDSEDFDKEVSKKDLQELFKGHNSFIEKTSRIIRTMEASAKKNEISEEFYLYKPVTSYSASQITNASNCKSLANVINKNIKNAYNDSTNQTEFASFYNEIINKNTGYAVSNMINTTLEYKNQLAKIGISIGADNNLSYETTAETTTIAESAYNALFDSDASSYASKIKQQLMEVFNNELATSSINVSVQFDESV